MRWNKRRSSTDEDGQVIKVKADCAWCAFDDEEPFESPSVDDAAELLAQQGWMLDALPANSEAEDGVVRIHGACPLHGDVP